MFFSQPFSIRFGTCLIEAIQAGVWTKLDIAVAWVRASGIAHLEPALTEFLKTGNTVRITVGIDLDNTTKEGLAGLLALQRHGAMSIFVHHNEAGTIFHPKLYLFQNDAHAKLIVGSNNITEAGLYQNTEAGLELDALVDDPVIISAKDALDSWRDTKLNLARELDAALLNELVSSGYVYEEATMKAQLAARRAAGSAKGVGAKKLFGGLTVTPPARPGSIVSSDPVAPPGKKAASTSTDTLAASVSVTSTATGQVLLMRVRKAHATDRPTQTQIPKEVANTPFFRGIQSVLSVHSGDSHSVREASARGIINTLKLEIPEMRRIADPVVRFERTPTGIQYEVYESSSTQGKTIMNTLRAGLTASPPTTRLTRASTPGSSTWWRFI